MISAEHQRGNSQRGIGRLLARPASMIGREQARGRQDDGRYCPQAARCVYDERRARCRRNLKPVERKTRFAVLCKMNGNGAEVALDSFSRQMKSLPAALRKSMTYDRGSKMACHPGLARRLKTDIRFCDPHAPSQRGSNENTNGLLRQFMPKGTDLSHVS